MIYFHHIAGTGGRSVIKSFLDREGQADLFNQFFDGSCQVKIGSRRFCRTNTPDPNVYFASSHSPVYACNLPWGGFRFTMIRDPIARFAGRYREHYLNMHLGYTLSWKGTTILESAQQMPQSVVLRQLAMVSKTFNVAEAITVLRRLNIVLQCETMNDSMAILSRWLCLNPPLRSFNVRSEYVDFVESITAKEIARARKRVMTEVREYYDDLREIFDPEYQIIEALHLT